MRHKVRKRMRFNFSPNVASQAAYITHFFNLVGKNRWYKRINQLYAEQKASPYFSKIVSDYHWLELAISHQADVLAEEGKLRPESMNLHALVALQFVTAVVEIHSRLSRDAQIQLVGRLRDGLKAESGFAAVYLEVDIAIILMTAGYDVRFLDIESSANYDLEFSRNGFIGEVECKSLSVDAGRRIHRKDFYRFVQTLVPQLNAHLSLEQQEVLVITLDGRLPSNVSKQAELHRVAAVMLEKNAPKIMCGAKFQIERLDFKKCLGTTPYRNKHAFSNFCKKKFGPNSHIAGSLSESGGCLVVMRSEREDDTSKPWLYAMRKAASQLTGQRPGFIAVQFQDTTVTDLMLPHFRRKAGILSYALFGHYCADHVNATYICGFGAVAAKDGNFGVPAFSVPNPKPKFPIDSCNAAPFLTPISDTDFAEVIGAPLPQPDISHIPF